MNAEFETPVADVGSWNPPLEIGLFGAVRTILLVEDEAFVRDVTCEVLRSAGYRVLCAKNADDAREMYTLHAAEVALLVTDIVLPGESGRVLAGCLRMMNPLLRILYMTGYGEQMALSTGVEILAKPFSCEVLLEKISKILECEIGFRAENAETASLCEQVA